MLLSLWSLVLAFPTLIKRNIYIYIYSKPVYEILALETPTKGSDFSSTPNSILKFAGLSQDKKNSVKINLETVYEEI